MAKTVMIVIEDEYLRKLVLASLRKTECRTIETTSSSDALNLLKVRLPSILVVDINLSQTNTLSLTRYLLEHSEADACQLLVIARSSQMSKVRIHVTRASEFIAKPFSPIDLRTRIEQMLSMSPEEDDPRWGLN